MPEVPKVHYRTANMLRIPPTSIALSERDLDEHFYYIGRLQNLRREGFRKEQIQQLYEQQQKSLRNRENDNDYSSERAPSYGSQGDPPSSPRSEDSDTRGAPAMKTSMLSK